MHGRFTWYELYTNDTNAAKQFYPAITGWGVQRWDESSADNPYEMWTAAGEPFGGMMPLSEEMKAMGAPPHWLAYVEVNNAEQTLARATGLGATVLWGPETVPTVGKLATIRDPQGATIAILQPENSMGGFDGKPALGKPSWHELLTTDYVAAFNFYASLFGWTKIQEMDVGGGMKYLTFGAGTGDRAVGGMFNRGGPMANVPPNWLIYTNVRDAKGSVDAIKRAGGTVINGPMEVPGGDWIVAFTDPEGVAHAVHTVPAKAPAKPAVSKKPKATKAKKAKAKSKPAKKSKKKAKKEKKKEKKAKKKAKKQAKKAAKKARKQKKR